MQHDEVIWSVLGQHFCSFKLKSDVTQKQQSFCRNKYNATGLCNRQSCPLANSRYATVLERDGVCYLQLKTIERAHSPLNMWDQIKLSANYAQALQQIDSALEHWPEYLKHRCKQRLTKIHQYLIRMRKLRLEIRPKLVSVSRKVDRRETNRERKAERAARLTEAISAELVARLQAGTYDESGMYLPEEQYNQVLDMIATEDADAEDPDAEAQSGDEEGGEMESSGDEFEAAEDDEDDDEDEEFDMEDYVAPQPQYELEHEMEMENESQSLPQQSMHQTSSHRSAPAQPQQQSALRSKHAASSSAQHTSDSDSEMDSEMDDDDDEKLQLDDSEELDFDDESMSAEDDESDMSPPAPAPVASSFSKRAKTNSNKPQQQSVKPVSTQQRNQAPKQIASKSKSGSATKSAPKPAAAVSQIQSKIKSARNTKKRSAASMQLEYEDDAAQTAH